ncbi:MAG: glycosyltransferase family 2 protein [Dehalococcoidia bacterium]|nr:MAG: glycosyltransferase family 2 protein [Dehalococcoidia bacterium]
MKKTEKQTIIVGMPAYNEEKYIGSVILQARQFADEVVVVDDGSSDHTAQVARLAGATVVQHERNSGYGATVQTVLAEAKKRNPDVLVLLDADGQHNPEEISSLVNAIYDGADVAIGSRQKHSENIPAYRKFGQNIISYFTRVLSRSTLSDTESGFRAFSRKAINVLEPKERGMAISAETISEATAKGLKIAEVPISAIYTRDGSTLNPIKHGMGVLNRVLVMISERRPLLFFGLVGGIAIILGIVAGALVLKALFTVNELAVGTAMVAMLLITVGTLFIFAGVILNVLVKRLRDSL